MLERLRLENQGKRPTKRGSALSSRKPSFRQWPHFLLSAFHIIHRKVAQNKGRETLVPEAHLLQALSKFEGGWQPKNHSKGLAADIPVSCFYFSHHIPLVNWHSPSTVSERLCCCDGSARELHWHCDHSERREPSDSELTPNASSISWQRRSVAPWQLNATRPKLSLAPWHSSE